MYEHKTCNGQPGPEERFDALDFLARVISHIQEPRLHFAHDLGHYSNVSRGRRRKGKEEPLTPGHPREKDDDGLTDREREILQLLVDGLTIRQIASRLGVSFHTVDSHIRNIYAKLHVRSRASAVGKAVQERLV